MKHSLGRSVTRWFVRLIRNSKYRWLVILGSLIYLISPLDISPDVFPVIGWIDDGLLATIVISELTQSLLENRRRTVAKGKDSDKNDKPDVVIDVESFPVG